MFFQNFFFKTRRLSTIVHVKSRETFAQMHVRTHEIFTFSPCLHSRTVTAVSRAAYDKPTIP